MLLWWKTVAAGIERVARAFRVECRRKFELERQILQISMDCRCVPEAKLEQSRNPLHYRKRSFPPRTALFSPITDE